MGFRCELCDDWLPMLSFCKLCDKCYKIRTIVKCYNSEKILNNLQEYFLVSHAREEESKLLDEKFFTQEEERMRLEFENDLKELQEKKIESVKQLESIKEEEPISPKCYENIVKDNKLNRKSKRCKTPIKEI